MQDCNGSSSDDRDDYSLHFQLGAVKSGLVDVKERLEDIRTGDFRARGSGETQQEGWRAPTPPPLLPHPVVAMCAGSSADLMVAAESMQSLRASRINLRKSQWSLRGERRRAGG